MATIGPLTATWGADVEPGGTKYPADGSDFAGGDGTSKYRTSNKFDISSLPTNATVTQVDFSIYVSVVAGAGSLLWDIGCYGTNGQGNPESDSGATMYTNSAPGNVYVNDDTNFRTTGQKTFTNLGSQANTDVEAARDAGSIFSIAIQETTDTGVNSQAQFREYNHGTTPPQLTITYTVPAKGLIMLMGDGGFL